jgi:phage N-6-adenine-methyltransferase
VVSLIGFKAENHPQQVAVGGAIDDVDDRATHPDIFGPLHERFDFTIDVAAGEHNTKCERFYDLSIDGLAQSWAEESVWCNPPYSDIRPWVEKAWAEWHAPKRIRPTSIVMLLPANRTEQGWWQDLVEPYRDSPRTPLSVEFLEGRIRFIKAGRTDVGPNERPPFGCCLLIWRRR